MALNSYKREQKIDNKVEKKTPTNPADRIKRFLGVLALVTPLALGSPSIAKADDGSLEKILGGVGESLGRIKQHLEDLKKLEQEEMDRAKEFGPEVFEAFTQYRNVSNLIAGARFEMQKQEVILRQAREIEADTSSMKRDYQDVFLLAYEMTPADYIREIGQKLEQMRADIARDEVLKDALLQRYIDLEKKAETSKN